jgi:MFS family permease
MGGLDLFIYRLKHDLHQGPGAVGFVLGMSGAGAIVAGVLSPTVRRRFGFGVCWIGGLLGTGLGLVGIALTTSVAAIVVLAVSYMFVNTVMGVTNMSLRQEVTPDHLLGRVTAAFWTLAGITAPIGAAVATALAAPFGSAAVLCGMGVGVSALAFAALFTPVRIRRPERLFAPRDDLDNDAGEMLAG